MVTNPIIDLLLLLQVEVAHTSRSTVNVSESEIAIAIAMTMSEGIMTVVDMDHTSQTEWWPRRC